jgi:hypothetical protein
MPHHDPPPATTAPPDFDPALLLGVSPLRGLRHVGATPVGGREGIVDGRLGLAKDTSVLIPAEPDLRDLVLRHYRRCEEVLRSADLEGFLDWLGPEGTFEVEDGSIVRIADTRPFWEWRFANVVDVSRCDMTVEQVTRTDRSLLVVDFHEVTHHRVRGFDGEPIERTADLRNRNWWRVDGERLTFAGGAESTGHRTIGGRESTDEIDPWGLTAWRRHQAGGTSRWG